MTPAEVDRVTAVLGVARLHQGDGDYLVAWDGDEPLGHLHLTRSSPPELQDIEVREAHRGRGVGAALVADAAQRALERGETVLRLGVSVRNDRARALYERLGFRDANEPHQVVKGIIEIRTGPIEVDDEIVVLEKPIA